ncbi:hypothetical protein D3C71_1648200 [compost metagenome]
MQLWIDIRERRHIDNRSPARSRPNIRKDINPAEVLRPGQEHHRFAGYPGHKLVNRACRRQEDEQHADHDDDGNEIGRVQEQLNVLFDAGPPDLIQHQGQQDRNGKAQNQSEQAEFKRIHKYHFKVG